MKVVMLLRSDELRLFFPCFVHLPQGTDERLSFLKGSEDVTPVRIRQTAVTEPQFPKIKLYDAFPQGTRQFVPALRPGRGGVGHCNSGRL